VSELETLSRMTCKACEGGTKPFSAKDIKQYLSRVRGWKLIKGEIVKTFTFKNYYETISFVNATAWISNQENHHPDLEVGYKNCKVRYMTHSIKGLSENDFICAAKLDGLLEGNS